MGRGLLTLNKKGEGGWVGSETAKIMLMLLMDSPLNIGFQSGRFFQNLFLKYLVSRKILTANKNTKNKISTIRLF